MNLAQHFQAATSTGLENTNALMGGASLEASVVDVVEAGYAVAENARVEAELQDVTNSLESYREALSLSQESGNIDQTAASWMLAAGEAITGRVGVSLNSVSTESFGSPSDAADAVELISLEAGGLFDKLVQAIKELIAKARVALKGLWVKLTDGGAKLTKRGEALAKKAKDTKGKPSEDKFEASFIGKVHLDGKAPTGTQLVSAVKALDSLAKRLFNDTESTVKAQADAVKAMLGNAGEGKAFDATGFVKLLAKFDDALGLNNTGPAHLSVGDGTVASSDELIGGKVIFVSSVAGAPMVGKAVAGFSVGVGSASETDKEIGKGEVVVLSTSECGDLGGSIKMIGESLTGFNKNFQARDKMKDMVNSELDKIQKKMTKDEKDMSPEQKQAGRDSITAVRAALKSLDNPVSDYARYLMTTLATVVAWGEKSLSMHKES